MSARPSDGKGLPNESKTWASAFVFGEGWAAYRGRVSQNDTHAHVAVQLLNSVDKEATLVDEHGNVHRGNRLIVPSLVKHALRCEGPVCVLYLGPLSRAGHHLRSVSGPERIRPLPASFAAALDPERPAHEWHAGVDALLPTKRTRPDPRLTAAMQQCVAGRRPMTVSSMAAGVGLSCSRLRALASRDLGYSLSTWLLWRKLELSGQALLNGESLAEAAVSGGFSDQGHFGRTMRRMFGVTPRVAQRTLRNL